MDGKFECTGTSCEPCPENHYQCQQNSETNGTLCLPEQFHCDGVPDCIMGDDEVNCSKYIVSILEQRLLGDVYPVIQRDWWGKLQNWSFIGVGIFSGWRKTEVISSYIQFTQVISCLF